MHELPVISRILDICLRHAARNGGRKILSIELLVGPFSDLQPEWMQRYFDHLARDTIAAGARLKIEKMPLCYKCGKCGHEFTAAAGNHDAAVAGEEKCPECDSIEVEYVAAGGYQIGNMEIV